MQFIKDYLPIVLSIAAIVTTFITVYKQNKIELFEIRYKTYNVLCYLFSVAEVLFKEDISSTKVVLYSSMETYRSCTTLNDTLSNGDDVRSFYTGLVFEAGKAEHIFKKKHIEGVMSFLVSFNNLVSTTYTKKSYEAEIEELRNIYLKVKKHNFDEKLKKYLKI